ncbi:MAG: hypothetical protein V2I97_01805, partial [Desulfococcaceae bacterium]|nr:hypothetical protein [Desulfococcaceae bacterium]
NIIASEPLDKVWAVVIPPDDSASCEIKQISLEMYNDGTGKYTADCRLFFREGSYNILIYAKDTAGSVSDPKQISISQLIDIQAVKGDINGDGEANLTDAVIALRVMTDSAKEGDVRWNYPASGADIDGNSSAGMAEAIYLLQYVAQLQ